VPSPSKTLYYNDCKLEAIYPAYLIAHGGALKITCLSYDGSINFGYIGLRDSLTNMQNLAELSGEAIKELEALIKAKTAIQQKTKTKSKRKVKSKTKA
jgi:hypothetical protein